MALKGYDNLLLSIDFFKNNQLSFYGLRSALAGSRVYDLGVELGYEKDLYQKIDAWFECIEFCYLEKDWYELALSICNLIEDGILNETKPFVLPINDRVVAEQKLAP